jgi:hypothetical protein
MARQYGHQSKCNSQFITKFCDYVKKGYPNKIAAGLCGIDESSIYRWKDDYYLIESLLNEGKQLENEMFFESEEITKNIRNCKNIHKFFRRLEESKAKYLSKALDTVDEAMDAKDVSTAKWVLEKRLPQEFGNKQEVAIANKDGIPFKQDVRHKPMLEEFTDFIKEVESLTLGKDFVKELDPEGNNENS